MIRGRSARSRKAESIWTSRVHGVRHSIWRRLRTDGNASLEIGAATAATIE